MESTGQKANVQAPSRLRILLMWLLMLGVIMFWVVFFLWRNHGRTPTDDSEPGLAASIVALVIGGFFLVGGVAVYLAAIFTGCFNFNCRRPVWQDAKVRRGGHGRAVGGAGTVDLLG